MHVPVQLTVNKISQTFSKVNGIIQRLLLLFLRLWFKENIIETHLFLLKFDLVAQNQFSDKDRSLYFLISIQKTTLTVKSLANKVALKFLQKESRSLMKNKNKIGLY